MTQPRPRRRGLRLRDGALGLAVLGAVGAVPALAAFQLDGTTANTPGNLQPAGQPSVVLGGLKGVGNARVPWIAQTQANPGGGARQIFVEKFAGGAFSLQGGSLNFNPAASADHPSIDFAGKGFSVPWSGWSEPAAGVDQIFASKFNPNADLSNGAWEINGALRTSEANPALQRGPSLNIHTDQPGTEPQVAGGTLVAGNDPTPWVTWLEGAGVAGFGDQIFVTKGVKDSAPSATQAGSFTWHPQGTDRGPAGIGPTLNVEINNKRQAVHPDNTFTGPGNTVPWVVWYEEPIPPAPQVAPNNQRVFASKFVPDPTLGAAGGRWVPVGNSPSCQFSAGNEDPNACSLNKVGTANAENPNVAAGSLDPSKPTVPWVAWHEEVGQGPTLRRIFISRLVGGTTFQIFPGPNADGSLNADPNQDADEPDVRFEGNVLHVSWKETVPGGKLHEFERSFTPGAGGQGGSWSPATDLQVDPSQDAGSATIHSFGGSAFVTWAEGTADPADPAANIFGHTLLKHSDATETAQTGLPTAITATGATLAGAAAGDPGVFAASFDVSVGASPAVQSVPVGDVTHNAPDPSQAFSAPLSGLAPNSIVHVRAKLATAFGTLAGQDQPFVTAGSGAPGAVGLPPTPKKVKVTRKLHTLRVSFNLSRKWKVFITVHKRSLRGPVVGRLVRKFKKGHNVVRVRVTATGRMVVVIKPRAATRAIVKTALVR